MTDYAYPVLREPFEIEGGGDDRVQFTNNDEDATDIQTFAAAIYINKGETSSGGPADLIDQFQTRLQAAATALSLTGTFTAALLPSGHVSVVRTGGTSPDDDLLIEWNAISTTLDAALLGFEETQFRISDTAAISPFQAGYQWHPKRDVTHEGPWLVKKIASADRDLNGYEHRLAHNANGAGIWMEKNLRFHRVPAAALINDRAASAAHAAVAGVSTGEPNNWEAFWHRQTGAFGPYGDHRLYYYDHNDPTLHTQVGPCQYLFSESKPGIKGIEAGSHRRDDSAEFYPVEFTLRKDG